MGEYRRIVIVLENEGNADTAGGARERRISWKLDRGEC